MDGENIIEYEDLIEIVKDNPWLEISWHFPVPGDCTVPSFHGTAEVSKVFPMGHDAFSLLGESVYLDRNLKHEVGIIDAVESNYRATLKPMGFVVKICVTFDYGVEIKYGTLFLKDSLVASIIR